MTSPALAPPAVRLPRHVGVIMDGNGRWAEARGLARHKGHAAGVDAVRAIVRAARKLGLEALTLYSFSTENWGRPRHEVDALMALLVHFLGAELEELLEQDIRLAVSGQVERLPESARAALAATIGATSHCESMVLNLALSYGGRQEIVQAVQALAGEVAAGRLLPEDIDEEAIESRLWTAGLPPLELIVRTAGEMRLSNFLLWQSAYAEYYSTALLWPDFREEHLQEALDEFGRRRRRFGLTAEQIAKQGRSR